MAARRCSRDSIIQLFTIISVVNRGFAGGAASLSPLSSLPRFTTLIKVFMTSLSEVEQVDSGARFCKKPSHLEHKHSFCCAHLKKSFSP
jgi:hypothetical protein